MTERILDQNWRVIVFRSKSERMFSGDQITTQAELDDLTARLELTEAERDRVQIGDFLLTSGWPHVLDDDGRRVHIHLTYEEVVHDIG